MAKSIVNLVGKAYGRLIVLKFSYSKSHKSYWSCRCLCGNETIVRSDQLTRGTSRSCGCLHKDIITTHGDTKSKEYQTWIRIKKRCHNPDHKSYSRYGGRGIKVCRQWMDSYDFFLSDMGRAPSNSHSIERIDNDGDYGPNNCFWATRKEQANNRSSNRNLNFKGETKNIRQWCEALNLNYSTVYTRLCRGWTTEKALSV